METLSQDAVLLIIDVQMGFDDSRWGLRNNPDAEANIARLLAAWRATDRPVIHIQHLSTNPASPLHPDQAGCAIKDIVRPWAGEPVITKHVNSAFIGTDLEQRLRAHGYRTLVVVGLTTDHCVSTTTRMAGNLGFQPYVVGDATATFGKRDHIGRVFSADVVHAINLASLHDEFAQVVDTATVLDWAGVTGDRETPGGHL